MRLAEYLAEVEHAVRTVIAEIHSEHETFSRLQQELAVLTAATQEGYRRASFLALNPDLDDEGLGTAIHWDTYFGPDKDRYHKAADLQTTRSKIEGKRGPNTLLTA